VCVYTASHMQFINCLDAGECGMIVGPHSTKLPQSWDTGSDQPSVPASFDVFLFHSIWQGAKPRTPTLRNTFPLTFPDRLPYHPYLGILGDDYLNVLMIFLFKHAVCVWGQTGKPN
jgi:hypothetical protein